MPDTARLPNGLVAALRPLAPDAPWIEPWRALGGSALVANPFYEADYAVSAATAFGAGVRLLLVADRPPEEQGARLAALWPFRTLRTRWGLPLPVLMGWTHGFCPFGAPLLDMENPERALAALLAAPRALGLAPRLLMPNAPATGPFADLLAHSGTRCATYWRHERAVLDTTGLGAEGRAGYLGHMTGTRRRKLRLAAEHLVAAAPVTLETIREPGALAAALEDYVALETRGWKGRAGTALGYRPQEAAFMRAMVGALGARGHVRIDRLRREGRTLAAAILPLTGPEAWFLKISYDEAEAAGAPGVQLVHRLTQAILREGDVTRLDSCAAPDYRLAEMFWTGRRAIAHTLVEGLADSHSASGQRSLWSGTRFPSPLRGGVRGGGGAEGTAEPCPAPPPPPAPPRKGEERPTVRPRHILNAMCASARSGGDPLFPLAAGLERARERVSRWRAARR